MDWFNMIKRFHEKGFWTDSMVGDAVIAKKLTEEQYKQITGLDYGVEPEVLAEDPPAEEETTPKKK